MIRFPVTSRSVQRPAFRLAVLALAASLAGCSTIEGWFFSDKDGYRTQARQVEALQVPPDLSQLDNRTVVPGTVISAAAMQSDGATPGQPGQARPTAAALRPSQERVALNSAGDVSFEHLGTERWVHATGTPEALWPQAKNFWLDQGYTIETEKADIGLMETGWREDRSKLPTDLIRSTLGKLFDGLWDSGLRDKFRTRFERDGKGGTNIYISQQGLAEVYTDAQHDNTAWQPRPNDPQLEALMLSRLMLKLGGKDVDPATLASAASAPQVAAADTGKNPGLIAPDAPVAARITGIPDQILVNDDFDRAWRRVGQSLDRHGFTVEDRDRPQGLFYLRYADPTQAGKDEPNFFQKLFGAKETGAAGRYRVKVLTADGKSTVMILDNTGKQVTDENAKRILGMLMNDLR
ncbi:MAG TPA: outer membrane protein assembly factor BamC [Burkholderiaceae bacterium]